MKTKAITTAFLLSLSVVNPTAAENDNGNFIDNDSEVADYEAQRMQVGKYRGNTTTFSIPRLVCTEENKEFVEIIGLKGIPHTPCPE